MEDIKELYKVLKIINEDLESEESPLPIISFEGLPGAGKTTQIELVTEKLKKYGESEYIDLPTENSIGKILKYLYSNSNNFYEISNLSPWFNTIMVSVDLRLAIKKAKIKGCKRIIMSRGLLSTYYYNYDAYLANNKYDLLKKQLKGFYKPTVIIFLEIPIDEAHKRVVERNRGELRKMDYKEQMLKDEIFLKEKIKELDIPVYYVNATGTKEEVTNRIIEILKLKGCL